MICDICGNDVFTAANGRPFKWCSKCEAMERHRYMARKLKKVENWPSRKFLDIAPLNHVIWKGFLRNLNCGKHICIDKWRTGNPSDPRDVGFADIYCDVVGMDHVLSDRYDIVTMEQVLDEIPDYMGALRSIEAVLKPGGVAYIGVAADVKLDKHIPAGTNHFGNVWKFGQSPLATDMRTMFAEVTEEVYIECGWRGNLFECQKRR